MGFRSSLFHENLIMHLVGKWVIVAGKLHNFTVLSSPLLSLNDDGPRAHKERGL